MKDPYSVLKYPLSKEKSVRAMEAENKIIFIVDAKATKKEIKEAMEQMFKVKVLKVNTLFDMEGRKKAYIKLAVENPAIDVMTKLGLM